MKQSSEMRLRDNDSDTAAAARAKRLAGPNRWAQILRTASAQFAMTGLCGTTTLALAQAAGISEAILYVHFGSKTQLFREAVEINSETRLRSLDSHLSSIGGGRPS
jgi:AcrR family transcriptional regulator